MELEKYVESLKKIANKRCAHEVEGWFSDDSGNYDDTYRAGQRAGEIESAREALAVLDPSFKVEIEPED